MTYRYHHTEYFIYQTPFKGREFFENEFVRFIPNGLLTIKGTPQRPFSWDGCSPKKNILQITFGTPDGMTNPKTGKPMTYFASMVHDAIYQNKAIIDISRLEADRLFRDMLREEGFIWWRVYYLAVRAFGWIYGNWKRK